MRLDERGTRIFLIIPPVVTASISPQPLLHNDILASAAQNCRHVMPRYDFRSARAVWPAGGSEVERPPGRLPTVVSGVVALRGSRADTSRDKSPHLSPLDQKRAECLWLMKLLHYKINKMTRGDSSEMRDAPHMRRQRAAGSDVRVGGRHARPKKNK